MERVVNQTLETDQTYPYYIFISDIHGNLETLKLIEQAQRDYPEAQLVAGGDYVDGRLYVKEVLEFLMKQKGIILRGNHEQMLINYAEKREHQSGIWFFNGGDKTLLQLFGKKARPEEVTASDYYRFLVACPIMYETPGFIFVHAGVRSDENYNDPQTYAAELDVHNHQYDYDFYRIWAREPYWYSDGTKKIFAHNLTGKTIVTGHTPTSYLVGSYDDGSKFLPSKTNPVVTIKYPNEPARIFTDGGSHSDPIRHPHYDGNVVVLSDSGKVVKVYNYQNTLKGHLHD